MTGGGEVSINHVIPGKAKFTGTGRAENTFLPVKFAGKVCRVLEYMSVGQREMSNRAGMLD